MRSNTRLSRVVQILLIGAVAFPALRSTAQAQVVLPLWRDNDHDGYTEIGGDCNDADWLIYPGAPESCDGVDQDCDGLPDVEGGADATWERTVCNPTLPAPDDPGIMGWDQPTVLYREDLGLYQMWYRIIRGDNYAHEIGYAESTNGRDWTIEPQAVLLPGAPGEWDSVRLGYPSVIYVNGTYLMYYHGNETNNKIRIGMATSRDGLSWKKETGNPILLLGEPGSWDAAAVHAPTVLYDPDDATFKMWYSGSNGVYIRIGYATSPDGFIWTKYPTFVLDVGAAGDWDDKRVVFCRVHKYNGEFHMWFSGDDSSLTYTYEIGHATSTNGKSWTLSPDNPEFSFDSGSSDFDAYMVYGADVIPLGDGYAMYYSGGGSLSGPFDIGMAYNSAPF